VVNEGGVKPSLHQSPFDFGRIGRGGFGEGEEDPLRWTSIAAGEDGGGVVTAELCDLLVDGDLGEQEGAGVANVGGCEAEFEEEEGHVVGVGREGGSVGGEKAKRSHRGEVCC
jgi:hypothetical protein